MEIFQHECLTTPITRFLLSYNVSQIKISISNDSIAFEVDFRTFERNQPFSIYLKSLMESFVWILPLFSDPADNLLKMIVNLMKYIRLFDKLKFENVKIDVTIKFMELFFSFVNEWMLRPLPMVDKEVMVGWSGNILVLYYSMFLYLREDRENK